MKKLSDAEWALMEALWEARRATARALTARLAAERGWAYSTVKTMLDRLADKGAVRARRVGRGVEFSPAISPERARRGAWRGFVDTVFGGAMDPALRFLATEARLSAEQRDALRALLDGAEE